MASVALIAVWALLFLVTHMGISSASVRRRMLAALGEQRYRGVYSLISLATFVPLCLAFGWHKHSGAMLWDLRAIGPVRWLAWLAMLAAFVLFAVGIVSRSPAGMAPSSGDGPHGVLKVTRHPAFVAFALFGLAHMLMNGFVGDLIFFATFPVLGIVGGLDQDRRKLRDLGESYQRLVEQTSFLPFAAIWQGHQRLVASDVPWVPIGVAVLVTAVVVLIHPVLFGGYPLG